MNPDEQGRERKQEEEKDLDFEIESGKQDHDQQQQRQHVGDETVLQFLDSVDSYLTLLDSLSSTLRQGWLDLASARHSMGTSRVNSVLLDLTSHSASTSFCVSQDQGSAEKQPHFELRKWSSSRSPEDGNLREESDNLRLRRQGSSPSEEKATRDGSPLKADDQVQKERSKSLSVFGTLVSPKLRSAQLSFETALEMLVEIANKRSTMICTFDQLCN
ncbi:hypothetical protein K2173_009689 [Erythroxylum novogranatense]|uniref:Vacuolar ATPase assembly protein VMA22 n=1 Tax=Erythroxylum novogranatense TaxID=1862640 RepID=A0AAV8U8U8_9ROSI|nr:hypothetical protein K2173_009689 [Erythroxylum novogranatense]